MGRFIRFRLLLAVQYECGGVGNIVFLLCILAWRLVADESCILWLDTNVLIVF